VVDSADMADAVVVAGQCVLFRAMVTHINPIEELADVTILCSDKTSTLTSLIKYLRDRHNEATAAATRALADTSIS